MVRLCLINNNRGGLEDEASRRYTIATNAALDHRVLVYHQPQPGFEAPPVPSSGQQEQACLDAAASSSFNAKSLPYTVVSCSGQDENFPASELNKGVLGRGWQSQRFCFYPQELVVELESPSHIVNMQLLCHEYKIASKVDIFVGLERSWVGIDDDLINKMTYLGYVSLDSNDRTNYQARELKSIQVDSPATVVRLVLHECFPNKLNVYNQIGIVALIILGKSLADDQMSHLTDLPPPAMPDLRVQMPTSTMVADSSLHNIDPTTEQKISQLHKQKLIAVHEEDYDEAKHLKILIERLREIGERIHHLENQKCVAVKEEDYDCAKACKMEIEQLRQSCKNVEDKSFTIDSQPKQSVPNNCHTNSETHDSSSFKGSTKFPEVVKDGWTQTIKDGSEAKFTDVCNSDDTQNQSLSNSLQLSDGNGNLPPLDEIPDDILSPEPISESVLKDFGSILSIIDRFHVECLFSKQWQLRSKGLLELERQLHLKDTTELLSTFRCIQKVFLRALNDKVSNVFLTALQVLQGFISQVCCKVPNKEIQSCASEIVVVLLDKLGHSNVRTRDASAETLLFIASMKEIGLAVVSPLLLKSPKTQASWRPVLSRLQLILVAIPKFGVQPHNHSGFHVDSLMQFITECFNSPNGDVRTTAVRVTTEVYKLVGPLVEKYLKGVKSAIHEVLIDSFEKASREIRNPQMQSTSAHISESEASPQKFITT